MKVSSIFFVLYMVYILGPFGAYLLELRRRIKVRLREREPPPAPSRAFVDQRSPL